MGEGEPPRGFHGRYPPATARAEARLPLVLTWRVQSLQEAAPGTRMFSASAGRTIGTPNVS